MVSGTSDREDMSKTLLAMSSTAESCQAMRQSGCLPLLIQLIHASELEQAVRARAAEALANIVQAQTDEKRRRREGRVLKLLQTVREHCDLLKLDGANGRVLQLKVQVLLSNDSSNAVLALLLIAPIAHFTVVKYLKRKVFETDGNENICEKHGTLLSILQYTTVEDIFFSLLLYS